MQVIIYLNPLSYDVDGLRGSLGHILHNHLGIDFLILSNLTVVLLGIASIFFLKFNYNSHSIRGKVKLISLPTNR